MDTPAPAAPHVADRRDHVEALRALASDGTDRLRAYCDSLRVAANSLEGPMPEHVFTALLDSMALYATRYEVRTCRMCGQQFVSLRMGRYCSRSCGRRGSASAARLSA